MMAGSVKQTMQDLLPEKQNQLGQSRHHVAFRCDPNRERCHGTNLGIQQMRGNVANLFPSSLK